MKTTKMLAIIAALPVFGALTIAFEYQGRKIQDWLLPVSLQAVPEKGEFKPNRPILVTLWLRNGFPKGSLFFERFSLKPNEWNAETFNVALTDVYRNGQKGNLYRQRPALKLPITVSGFSLEKIPPQGAMKLAVDASKWVIRDGWIPGTYVLTFRLDHIIADKHSRLSVLSEPVIVKIVE